MNERTRLSLAWVPLTSATQPLLPGTVPFSLSRPRPHVQLSCAIRAAGEESRDEWVKSAALDPRRGSAASRQGGRPDGPRFPTREGRR